MNKNNTLLICPYPPPFGGVSSHLYELNNSFKNTEFPLCIYLALQQGTHIGKHLVIIDYVHLCFIRIVTHMLVELQLVL